MKENTAAVHVQVPVEVTSFLLNEKRTEITKIELKQRVTVLLIPNPHLETPNYRLERLRHDDPRLESYRASYTMVEEPDEEVGITRRDRQKAKQEPVIKGILPETPAPQAAPRPEPVVARQAAPVPGAPVVPAPTAPAAAAGGGFFAWVRKLFGAEPEAARSAAPHAASISGPESGAAAPRGERGERSRGERGGRGGRGARESREAREGASGERGARRERGEPARRDGRSGGRRGEAGGDGGEARAETSRTERQGRRGRGERAPIEQATADAAAAQATAGTAAAGAFVDTVPGGEASEAAEAERQGARRRRRRGGRGRAGERSADLPAEAMDIEGAEAAELRDTSESAGAFEPIRAEAAMPPQGGAAGEPSAAHEVDRRVGPAPDLQPLDVGQAPSAPSVSFTLPVPGPESPPAAVLQAQAVVEPFELPEEDLRRLAEAAGLEWVASDVDKVRAVQEAIASAPRPIHVPREPKPLPAIDEGPLVLVETRLDLAQVRLPFEAPQPPAPH